MNDDVKHIEEQQPDFENKKKKQGQLLLVLLAAMILFVVGIIYFTNQIGKKKEKSDLADLENIMPPEAKNKPQKLSEKYSKDYQLGDGSSIDPALSELTESNPTYKRRSNELLTDEDYSQIAKTKVTVQPKKKPLDKSSLDKINQQKIQQAKRSMEYHADPNTPMFKKSEEELREERLAQLERENNAMLAEKILKGLEQVNTPQTQVDDQATEPFVNTAFNTRKPTAPPAKPVGLQNNTNQNTIAKATPTGFYSLSTALPEKGLHEYDHIPAVVHGNGDGIVVQNGSSIKLRLLSETYLPVNGIKYTIPRNTLISGTVRISGDRVNIVVSSIRIDNNLIPVQMIAYDIDGSRGLYIPNLMDKNILARELAEAGSRPLSGTIWTQGSIGRQVGTQLATESARSLMQGFSQYARRKMNTVRVTIKPNYKVLLNAGTLENTEDTESINTY